LAWSGIQPDRAQDTSKKNEVLEQKCFCHAILARPSSSRAIAP
jgi:hypothetical protein